MTTPTDHMAIWALTTEGARLGRRLQAFFPGSRLFAGRRAGDFCVKDRFERLGDALPQHFNHYEGHVFIMAAGIVVRALAPLLRHKTEDPAVVVLDECGRHAVSLVSGHLGGANELARRIGACIGARPVITTATDLRNVPAIDLVARERGLIIENPEAIRHVSMALLEGHTVALHDPQGHLAGALPPEGFWSAADSAVPVGGVRGMDGPGVWVDDIRIDLPEEILVLRPASLIVGVGCNRNTPPDEILDLLNRVLDDHRLAAASIAGLASIDLKADEKGILALAQTLSCRLMLYSRDQLAAVRDIPSPSKVVQKHVGVKSVCEAAALLASENGNLVAPKRVSPNATIAIARKSFTSSVSVRGR
jgi:cobalt-precorrin 5A hydrolase